jgi:hypothetical protein
MSNESFIITDKDKDVILVETKNRHFIYPVKVNNCYISSASDTPIIGTYGLDSNVCIIMRDPDTTMTMLMNVVLVEQIELCFQIFDVSENIHVYMMGGNNESINLCQSLLDSLEYRNRYNIKFAHLIDPEINSIGIDSRNGELYVNPTEDYFRLA